MSAAAADFEKSVRSEESVIFSLNFINTLGPDGWFLLKIVKYREILFIQLQRKIHAKLFCKNGALLREEL